MNEELSRLKGLLATAKPGTPEYDAILKEIERIYRMERQKDIDADNRVNEAHRRELEEKKFQHEQLKYENQLEIDAKKEAFDKERFEFEQRKFEFEQEKFQHQAEVDSKRIELDEEKLKFDEEERAYTSSPRYTMRQIVKRGAELTFQAVLTGGLIVVTRKAEEGVILSKNAMGFIQRAFR